MSEYHSTDIQQRTDISLHGESISDVREAWHNVGIFLENKPKMRLNSYHKKAFQAKNVPHVVRTRWGGDGRGGEALLDLAHPINLA